VLADEVLNAADQPFALSLQRRLRHLLK
jgi:hypothetical protein